MEPSTSAVALVAQPVRKGSHMKKVLCLAALVAGVVGVSAAQASSPSASAAKRHVLGIVLPRHVHAADSGSGIGPLLYNGGPVMHTNKAYAIYWSPSGYAMQSGYTSLISR